jgi:hypothetical protein
MSTERELIELAAKACGIEIDHWRGGMPMVIVWEYGIGEFRAWNPKRDDGDCARMEAQLSICIEWASSWVIAWTGALQKVVLDSEYDGDKNAARRAASVAVAAEIGRLRAALGEKS